MMLEYTWFVALMVVSSALGAIYSVKDEEIDCDIDGLSAGQWLIGAFGAAMMALVISWEKTGAVVLSSLRYSLPQQGTAISELSAYVITGLACLIVVFGVPIGASFLAYRLRNKGSINAPLAE